MNRFARIILPILASTIFGIDNLHAQHGLKAEYYDGAHFDSLVAVKFVDKIDDYWNERAPVFGIDPHECSIRWTGKLIPGKSGNYKFSARVDDGIRVWIDDILIIDQWALNDVGIFENSLDLLAMQAYDLKVEYFNALIEGEVRLLWQIPGEEKEKTWFEYFFGGQDPYTVIEPAYFFRPDEEAEFAANQQLIAPAEKTPPVSALSKKRTAPSDSSPRLSAKPKSDAKPVTAGEAEKYIPKNIGFERATTTILESSIPELNSFARFLLEHSELSVNIEGHTDPVGDADLNLKLSKQRAYKIANFLANKGIARDRIRAEGFGGSRPLVVAKKGEYAPANRRVVFILSGFE